MRRRKGASAMSFARAARHSSGVAAVKCVRPASPISAQTPTGVTTKGTPTAMYCTALKPDLPASHSPGALPSTVKG